MKTLVRFARQMRGWLMLMFVALPMFAWAGALPEFGSDAAADQWLRENSAYYRKDGGGDRNAHDLQLPGFSDQIAAGMVSLGIGEMGHRIEQRGTFRGQAGSASSSLKSPMAIKVRSIRRSIPRPIPGGLRRLGNLGCCTKWWNWTAFDIIGRCSRNSIERSRASPRGCCNGSLRRRPLCRVIRCHMPTIISRRRRPVDTPNIITSGSTGRHLGRRTDNQDARRFERAIAGLRG